MKDPPDSSLPSESNRPGRRTVFRIVLPAAVLVAAAAGLVSVQFARHRAAERAAADRMNLQRIGVACLVYSSLNDGHFPASLVDLAAMQLVEPADLRTRGSASPHVCDYWYVGGLNQRDPEQWIVAYSQRVSSRDPVHVLFRDGRVETLEPADFRELILRQAREHVERDGQPPEFVPPR